MRAKKADEETREPSFLGLVGSDPLTVVIRGHIFIESRLANLIESKLVEPGAIDVGRLNFHNKVGLAVALGSLPIELKQSLKTLNGLRNRLAHNVHAQITRADAERLFKSLPKTMREVMGPKDHTLLDCIAFLYGRLQGLGDRRTKEGNL
jgi:hypothetical protein